MAVGFIFEANPFHFGHRFLIKKAQELYPNEPLIMVTSTSFTMRGEISLYDKFSKTNIYLNEGLDLVFELPFSKTLQSADYFGCNAVKILNLLNVDKLIIGCETSDVTIIDKIYNIINSDEYKLKFKENLSLNLSYKQTFNKTLEDLNIDKELIELFSKPNMTLAFQYYQAIKKLKASMSLILVKRTNDYYGEKTSSDDLIVSSSFIRKKLLNEEKICQYLPYESCKISLTAVQNNLRLLFTFQTMNLSWINDDEGIYNYIVKNGDFSKDLSSFVDELSNKRYSKSRLRRVILWIILNGNLEKNDDSTYLRLLGLSKVGQNYLGNLPKEIKQLIFSSPNEVKESNKDLKLELKATKLYDLITDNNLYINEFKLPIKKEGI